MSRSSFNIPGALLTGSFMLSGAAALMYQVSWQRSLYGMIGVDMDSITIIVSMFMFGLGFGGVLGGWFSDLLPKYRIQIYAFAELSIASYGFCSLRILEGFESWLVVHGVGASHAALTSFLFLAPPTLLMGMTLPLLTIVFNEWRGNIGVSVGQLYFMNTLGAAAGAGLVPFVLLPIVPLDAVIRLAALGNLVVAALALIAYACSRNVKVPQPGAPA